MNNEEKFQHELIRLIRKYGDRDDEDHTAFRMRTLGHEWFVEDVGLGFDHLYITANVDNDIVIKQKKIDD